MNIFIAIGVHFAPAWLAHRGQETPGAAMRNLSRNLRLVNFRLSHRGLFRGAT